MIQRRIHYAAMRNEARDAAVERQVRLQAIRRKGWRVPPVGAAPRRKESK